MLPLDVARCPGSTSVRGQPLPPCVRCERRVMPTDEAVHVPVSAWEPMKAGGEWRCAGQIPYGAEEVA